MNENYLPTDKIHKKQYILLIKHNKMRKRGRIIMMKMAKESNSSKR